LDKRPYDLWAEVPSPIKTRLRNAFTAYAEECFQKDGILLKAYVPAQVGGNTPKEEYLKVTRPSFGDKSFEAMQRFAIDCKKYVKTVVFTVVDVIGSEEIAAAQEIADKLSIPLRVRKYES